jgi:RNA polymerase sigma-70 factor, ECF subfamily
MREFSAGRFGRATMARQMMARVAHLRAARAFFAFCMENFAASCLGAVTIQCDARWHDTSSLVVWDSLLSMTRASAPATPSRNSWTGSSVAGGGRTPDSQKRSADMVIQYRPEFEPRSHSAARLARRIAERADDSADVVLDSAILNEMVSGRESALAVLYDRWADAVHALVLRIVRTERDAEEVVDAVFWQAWRQAGSYRSDHENPGTWLLAMARSRSLDYVRSQRRRRDELPAETSIFDTQHTVGDPLTGLGAKARANRVVAALGLLPEAQRDVLDLAYFEGLSETRIAERLVLPLGTVKARARLALRKLRDRLDVLREVANTADRTMSA